MTRRRLLWGGCAIGALLAGLPARRARAGAPTRLLVLWSAGGWDPTFVFDPPAGRANVEGDPDATLAEINGIPFANAETRPSVRRFFERYGDRAVVINGLAVGSISHEGCTRLLLTGGRDEGRPDLATALAAETGAALALPHVVVSGPRYPGSLGASVVPLNATLAGVAAGTLPRGAAVDAEAEERVRAWLADEAERLGTSGRPLLQSWKEGLDALPTLASAIEALSIPEDPTDETRLQVAVRALQSGHCRGVTVAVGLPNQTTWDSHHANLENQDRAFENLFGSVLDVLDSLEGGGEGLLDQTLVMVLSEMGRAPGLNAAEGKDHWPYTSALLVGAGLSGGRVLGGTDEALVGARVDLSTGAPDSSGERLTPAHLGAGVLQLFEVDPEPYFPGVDPLALT